MEEPRLRLLGTRQPKEAAPEVPLFQMSELKLAAKRLDSGKAPGSDGILNEGLRAIIWEKPQLILNLLNTCLGRDHFPKQWKRQKLVLISKGRTKDPKVSSSWRPLCMLDSMGKLYERIIVNRVQSELVTRRMKGDRTCNTDSVQDGGL